MKLNCFIKQPGEKPYHTAVSDTLENLQKAVGGYIETLTLSDGTVAIFNEEGRLKGLDFCCNVEGYALFGPVLFMGTSEDEFADHPAQTLRDFLKTTDITY